MLFAFKWFLLKKFRNFLMKEGFYDNGIMRVDDKNGFLEKLDNNLSLFNMETTNIDGNYKSKVHHFLTIPNMVLKTWN